MAAESASAYAVSTELMLALVANLSPETVAVKSVILVANAESSVASAVSAEFIAAFVSTVSFEIVAVNELILFERAVSSVANIIISDEIPAFVCPNSLLITAVNALVSEITTSSADTVTCNKDVMSADDNALSDEISASNDSSNSISAASAVAIAVVLVFRLIFVFVNSVDIAAFNDLVSVSIASSSSAKKEDIDSNPATVSELAVLNAVSTEVDNCAKASLEVTNALMSCLMFASALVMSSLNVAETLSIF